MRFIPSRHLVLGVLVFLTLGINAVIAYLNIERLVGNERSVSLTFTVNDDIDELLSLVGELDASERAFVATGQASTLTAYRRAASAVRPALNRVAIESADPQQHAILDQLRGAMREYQALGQRSIEVRRRAGIVPAQALVASNASKASRSKVEELLGQIRMREQDILEERTTDSNAAASDATRTFWIATGTELAFLSLILFLLWRAARQNFALERAYHDLKRAEEMRDNLSAMLVHDLRTPLTSLLGPLNMLHSGLLGPLDETQRELVVMSEQSGQRLLLLVNELLDISKMEAGEFQVHRMRVEVRELVRQALVGVRVLGEGHEARIETSLEDPLFLIEVDTDIIVRVLINLLGNALKFTPATGKITLGTTHADQEMRFWVRDTGRGIPPEYQEKIFEKFGQVETRAQGKRFSTGLGLTFCKLAVEAHGGRIWIDSEVGHGSTFTFAVPLAATGQPAVKSAPALAAQI